MWPVVGLFKGNTTLQDGHIERRMAFKGIETEEEMKKELERQQVWHLYLLSTCPSICYVLGKHSTHRAQGASLQLDEV